MKRQLLTLLMLCMLTLTGKGAVCGDGPEFDTYEWDFGKILEKDGIVSHTFVLKNATGKDLQIGDAIPSCSCTTVSYSKDVIRPGETTEIEVRYTPSGAVGKVFREVQILDRDNNCIGMLEITADVEPADRSIPERYPFTLSPYLYAHINSVPFGYVYHATEKTKTVYLANSSEQPLHLKLESSDELLTLQYPEVLQPGQEAEMQLTFRTPDQPDYFAYVQDTLRFTVEGQPALMPIVTSMIALSKMEVRDTSPSLRSYPSSPRLKKKGKGYRARIDLYNDGEEALEIKALQLPPQVTANMQRGETIAKGKKRVLELSCPYGEDFRMYLFTNDPVRPMKEVHVTDLME